MKGIFDQNNEFHSEVGISIQEVLNNVFDHSELSKEAGIVGVINKSNHLSVCTVDMGQGIKNSFLSNPLLRDEYSTLTDENAIEKSTYFRVSCNPSYARHPNYKLTTNAGIGLYFLKNLVKMHENGQLILVSGKGYYYVDSQGREIKRNFKDVAWPGTLVYFRVNLNQTLNPKYRDLAQSI